jgi:hypothetical protein
MVKHGDRERLAAALGPDDVDVDVPGRSPGNVDFPDVGRHHGHGVEACKSDNTFRALAGDILKTGGPCSALIFSRNALTTGSKPFNLPIVSVLIDYPPLKTDR